MNRTRLPGLLASTAGAALKTVEGEAFADEGDKNLEISDSDRKMDALMDMIKDACTKLDEGHKRLDARMDSLDEKFKADSERRDSERKDARKDEDEGEEAADKRKDSRKDEDKDEEEGKREDARRDSKREDSRREDRKDEEKEEKREDRKDARRDSEKEEEDKREDARRDSRRKDEDEMDRKDARRDSRKDEDKEEEEKREDAHADSAPMTRAEAAALRADIARLSARGPAIVSDSDRERFARIQEEADPVFQAFGDRAPGPLEGETPTAYKRRLAGKKQSYSPKWKDIRLSAIADDAALDAVVADVYADAISAARLGADVPVGQLRESVRHSGGHTIITFDGAPESWMNSFAGNSQRATGDWRRPH